MNDQLFYDVVLQLDKQSVSEVQKQMDELQKSFDTAFKSAGGTQKAVNEFGQLVDITEKATKSNNVQVKSLVEAQKALEEKRKALSEVNKALKADNGLTDENAQSKLQLSSDIKQLTGEINKSQRETLQLNSANFDTANTYDQLVAKNKALMIQMKQVPLDDTTGRLKKLQTQYNANNTQLKSFDATLGNHQRNVGNYGDSLRSAAQQLAVIQGPLGPIAGRLSSLGTVINQVRGATDLQTTALGKLKVAIAATGIGALILVVGFLITQLLKLQPVMDFMNRSFAALGAAVGVLRDNIGALLGLNQKNTLSMREAAKVAADLRRQFHALRDIETESIGVKAKLELQIARLRDATKDENITNQERLELIDEAIQKEEQLLEIDLYLAKERARIAAQELAINESDAEAIKEVAEAEAELARIEANALNSRRRMRSERLGLINSIRNAEKKAKDDRFKELTEEGEAEIERINNLKEALAIQDTEIFTPDPIALDDLLDISSITETNQFLIDNFQETQRRIKEIQINELEQRGLTVQAIEMRQEQEFQNFRNQAIIAGLTDEAQIRAEFRQREIEFEAQKQKAIENVEQMRISASLNNIRTSIGIVENLNKGFFGNSKILNIGLATMDAIAAAVGAARDTPGDPFTKGLAAASQLAAGMARVRQIQKVNMGKSVNVSGGSGSQSQQPQVQGNVFQLREVGQQATNPLLQQAQGNPPTIILDGEFDPEFLAIKVKMGNNARSGSTVGAG